MQLHGTLPFQRSFQGQLFLYSPPSLLIDQQGIRPGIFIVWDLFSTLHAKSRIANRYDPIVVQIVSPDRLLNMNSEALE